MNHPYKLGTVQRVRIDLAHKQLALDLALPAFAPLAASLSHQGIN